MSTEPLIKNRRAGADPIVALRHLWTGATWLIPDRSPLTLGASSSCDISIAERGVSAQHAKLERVGPTWMLRDVSRNGTFVADARISALEICAGRIFTVAETPLVALSPMMLAATQTLELYVGLDQPLAVSNLLIAAGRDEPVLIVGKPGAGQVDLARAIHAISPRRKEPLVDLSGPEAMKRWQLSRAFRAATAIVELADFAPADLVREIWDALAGSGNWRWIVAAESEAHASNALRMPHLRAAHLVALRRLDERTDDRAALVSRVLAQFAPVELHALPEHTQRILTASRAYQSLAELRETVRRVAAIATAGVNAHAASSLGLELEHLQLWAAKVGLAARR